MTFAHKWITCLLTTGMLAFSMSATAQDDLLDMLDEEEDSSAKSEKVFATFKAIKLINATTIETTKKKSLEFRITHRFGNVGTESGGGHNLWGFDEASNIRFSFDYGITDNLQVGIGRSKTMEHLDGLIKWRFFSQTTDNKMPISAALYGSASFTPERDVLNIYEKTVHRLTYTSQLILARKFGSWLSLQVIPTYTHRNLVREFENGASDENDLFSMGFAARVKLTKRFAIVADYFKVFADRNNIPGPNFYDPLAVGIEVETGGHVFTINLSNSAGIMENDFIPNTREDWLDGAYKIGFNISRAFQF